MTLLPAMRIAISSLFGLLLLSGAGWAQSSDSALASYYRADSFRQSQPDSAFYHFQQALPRLITHQHWEEVVWTQLWLGRLFGMRSESDSMLHYYEWARESATQHLPATHSLRGAAAFNCAKVYADRGQFPEYMALVKQAIEIEKAQEQPNLLYLDTYYYGLASASRNMGDTEEAMRHYEQIIRRQEANPEGPGMPLYQVYFSKAEAYQVTQDYERALPIRLEGLALMEGIDVSGDRVAAIYYLGFLQEIALNYLRLNQPDEAIRYLRRAEARTQPEAFHAVAMNDFVEAEYRFQKADYAGAETAARKSLPGSIRRFNNREDHPAVAQTYELIAKSLKAQGRYQAAMQQFQHAYRVLSGLPKQAAFDQAIPADSLKPMVLVVQLLQAYGQTAFERYQETQDTAALSLAYHAYQAAFSVVPRIRKELYAEGSKLFFSEQLIPLIEEAIGSALAMHALHPNSKYQASAFAFAELSRLSLLYENVQSLSASRQLAIPAELLDEEASLRRAIQYQKQRIAQAETGGQADSSQLFAWRIALFEQEEARKQLLDEIAQRYPAFHQLKYDFKLASASEVQAYLAAEEAELLQYFWGENALFLFHLSPKAVHVHKIAQPDSLAEAVLSLKLRLEQPQSQAEDLRFFAAQARRLYKALLAPALKNSLPEKLILSPDGVLGYLPFELLLTQPLNEAQTASYRKLPYLLRDSEVQYSFSSSILLMNAPESSQGEYLGFAPSYGQLSTQAPSPTRSAFLPLVFNQPEVEAAQQLLGGRAFYQEQATEAAFKEWAASAQVLHLSLHAFTDDAYPLRSGLVFYQAELDSLALSQEAGILHAYELYGLNLQAQLAVLSACHTGEGKLQRGEGIMSLARAFRYAGCPSIVMSLWEAEGSATQEIVQVFFQHLNAGMDQGAALRLAKLAYLEQAPPSRTAPYFWGHLVLIGEGRPLSTSGSNWWLWGLGVLVVGLGGLAWWLRRTGKV